MKPRKRLMRKLAKAFATMLLDSVELEHAFGEARDDGIITEDEMIEIHEELIRINRRISHEVSPVDTYEMAKHVVKGGI